MTRDHRRLAAIVSLDVAGYSRLMGVDDSGTLAALKAHRRDLIDPKIAEHEGRIVKTTGDGLLLEFPSVVDAVRCAVDVQRGMAERNAGIALDQRLDFRIGINVGDIIIDGDDIFGDGVNVAARLEGLADPGGICASRVVRDQVLDKLSFTFEDLGAQHVKNIARPVEVYRIEFGATDRASTPSGALTSRRQAHARTRRWLGIATAACVVVAVGWVAFNAWQRAPASEPAPLSVTIEPFTVPAGDTAAARFAEGLMRLLQNELAMPMRRGRIRVQLAMGGRKTGGAPGQDDAGARYRIEGEVGNENGRFDVDARVVDNANGLLVHSTRHALRDSDVVAEFSPLRKRLVGRLRSAVFSAETQRVSARPVAVLTAPELVLRAFAAYAKDQSLAGVGEALRLVDAALRIDPNLAVAWAAKAFLVNLEGDVDPNQDRERIGREQEAFSARAVALDPSNPSAWGSRIPALVYLSRWDAALEAAARAEKLLPHDPEPRLDHAWILGLMGRPAETLAISEDVLQRDPDSAGVVARTACEANVLAGNARAAVTACEKSALLYGDAATVVYLVAAYANNGDAVKAAEAKAELLRIAPGYSIEQLRAKRYSDHPDYLVLAERNWYPGLRRAGIPER